MANITLIDSLRLSGFETHTTNTTQVKEATLQYYTTASSYERFGATNSYAKGYAVRGEWSNPYFVLLPASEIVSMSMIIHTSGVGYNISTRYGALASAANTSPKVTSASASTVTISKNATTSTISIASDSIATFKNAYGIGFGGAVSSASNGTVTDIQVEFVVNGYQISYNPGSYGTGSIITSDDVAYGKQAILQGPLFSRSGYTQKGWSINADGSTCDYKFGGHYKATNNVTLYPYWEREINNYTTNNGLIIHSTFIV